MQGSYVNRISKVVMKLVRLVMVGVGVGSGAEAGPAGGGKNAISATRAKIASIMGNRYLLFITSPCFCQFPS